MKALVPIKRVIDHEVRVHLKSDGSAVETEGVKHAINPFDEIALEEAVRLKEAGVVSEIITVSIGPAIVEEQLRASLALGGINGAARAIRIDTNTAPEPLMVAKLLAAIATKESIDLVLLGKQAIDGDAGQVPGMLAGSLKWPLASFASQISVAAKVATVEREVDAGIEVLELSLPAVISTDLRLNEPRYTKMPDVMKARSKPLDVLSPADLDVNIVEQIQVQNLSTPPKRSGGVKVGSIDELVDALKAKGF